jgi:hypothetical protein
MLMNYSSKRIATLIALLSLVNTSHMYGDITADSRNDPYPVFTTLDPQTFLQTREKLRLKGYAVARDWDELVGFSVSVFAQNSSSTRNDCLVTPPFSADSPPCNFTCIDNDTCLGNIYGRWSMLGLLLGPIPAGQDLAPSLQEALTALESASSCPVPQTGLTHFYIDRNQSIGFFDVPMRYKKRGIRLDYKTQIFCNIGLSFNLGLADISQTIAFFDRTPTKQGCVCINNCVQVDACVMERTLMENLQNIAPEIGLDIDEFHKFSIEDLRVGLFWREAFEFNTNVKHWEQFLLIPFLHVQASFPVGAKRNYNKFTSLSFGSNDHFAAGFSTGLNIDFTQTIEVGGEFGLTEFFAKDVCDFAVPTSLYQSGIYPFRTDVRIHPGRNWHIGLKMSAYHFLGDLSFYFQYMFIDHMQDHIYLKKCDPAFLPEELEDRSWWRAQLANIGFNYDISPDMSLGFLWQTPLPSRHTYRSTTVMLSFSAQY